VGRTLENKKEIVSNLKEALDESQMTVVIDYKGVSVAEITDLRNRLRQSGASCVVTKNTFMRRAIAEYEQWQPMEEFLKDSSAFLLLKDDLSSGIKAYRDFQKATKKTVLRGGVLEGKVLNEEEVKAIGDLPSKEELIAQIAGAINSLATKVAVGVKEVPASIARGIQAYADKDNDSGEAA
jgi:large subunit ribosomal protein L10